MEEPLISICILSWNRKKELLQSLKTIYSGDYKNIQVIVADNASSDGTQDEVKKKFKKVTLVESKENIGIAGWNSAFRRAKGKYTLFLDDDSFPKKGDVKVACEYLEQNTDVAAVALNVYTLNKKNKFVPDFKIRKPIDCHFFIGCGVMFRTEVYKKLSGFFPFYFLYGNEWEMALRIYGMGGKIVLLPDAHIYHMVSPTNRTSARRIFYGTRNSIFTILINYPLFVAILALVWALIREAVFALKNGNFRSWLEAIIDVFRKLPQIMKVRKPISYSNLLHFYRVGFNFWRALNSVST